MIHPAADIVEECHLAAGILLNCILLYAIRRFTRKSLGSYKQLLTIFASFDCFLIVLHAVVKPHVVIVGTVFGVTGQYDDRRITSFYASCFTVPFALMNIHFLYRFWSIRRPDLIPLFSKPKFIAFLCSFPIAEFTFWYLLCYDGITGKGPEPGKDIVTAEYKIRYGHEVRNGWLMMHHWENDKFNLQVFLSMIGFDILMVGSFTVAATFASFTFYYIKRADTISLQARSMQFKLLISVSAQTFVPLVCVYIPYFCVINFPFFYLPVFFWDHACMLLTSCFPAWDAVIIILLMKDYRDGLLGMTRKKKPQGPTTVWKTASSLMPSSYMQSRVGEITQII